VYDGIEAEMYSVIKWDIVFTTCHAETECITRFTYIPRLFGYYAKHGIQPRKCKGDR
jgi:glutamate mutase epsilon subunit